jgi:ketosteroid isomerase-like protein
VGRVATLSGTGSFLFVPEGIPKGNVDLVQEWFAATARRDLPRMLEIASPEIEYVPIMAALEGRVYCGHEGIEQWLDELYAHWETFEPIGEEFHERGDTVIALGCWHARGKVSRAQLDSEPATWVVEFRDGKMTRLQTYTSRADASDALGLDRSDPLRARLRA